jgi:2-amino-4-hydroxy-6-hydroxymethyldihydropteridine diphosphokinase
MTVVGAAVSAHPAAEAPVQVFVGLGANLGDAIAVMSGAVQEIARLPGTTLTRQSSLYKSAPVDAQGPDFFNAVVQFSTHLTAMALLTHLQGIENAAGRQRPYRNAPRTLDLDILLFGDENMHTQNLTVPHPRMYSRAFVLLPLREIAPHRVTVAQLQAVGQQPVALFESPAWPHHSMSKS